jgi:hypothetical protein
VLISACWHTDKTVREGRSTSCVHGEHGSDTLKLGSWGIVPRGDETKCGKLAAGRHDHGIVELSAPHPPEARRYIDRRWQMLRKMNTIVKIEAVHI